MADAIQKHPLNPILRISDITPYYDGFEVLGVFNAGVTTLDDEVILLARVAEIPKAVKDTVRSPIYNVKTDQLEILDLSTDDPDYDFSDPRVIGTKKGGKLLTSISSLRVGRSKDGVNFIFDEAPLVKAYDEYSIYGVEDPRITKIDETYYINFSAISNKGIVTKLFSTTDFVNVTDMGNIFHPDNKDVAIFPRMINGKYYALHRPSTSEFSRPNMWIASSPDLKCWGDNKTIAMVRDGYWDSTRIGASCVPFETEEGFVEIYHGADESNRYCLGVLLLDKNDPSIVIARSETPLVEPTEDYEITGFFGNVVFSCGHYSEGDDVHIYYGASDDSICVLKTSIGHILESIK